MTESVYTFFEFAKGRKIYAYTPQGLHTSSTPILCVHGWLDNHGSFLPLIEHMPPLPWIAIDLIGHGKSSWRSTESFYGFEDYICDLALWIETYAKNSKIHLVGHSLGASIVSILAGLYPDSVESLVLFDGAGPLVSDMDTMCEQFRLSIQQFLNPRSLRTYNSLETITAGRKKKHHITAETCAVLAKHGTISKPDGTCQWSFDPKLLSLSPFQMSDEEVIAILKNISAPTLFVRPLEGYPYPEELMQRRLHALKNLQYTCTPGGHHAHCDRPKENATILSNFYATLGLL